MVSKSETWIVASEPAVEALSEKLECSKVGIAVMLMVENRHCAVAIGFNHGIEFN